MGSIYLSQAGPISLVISEGDCECCGRLVQKDERMIRFGDEDIYYVCYQCLYKAHEMMEEK